MRNPEIEQTILKELDKIEQEYGVTIFYACESGSRAWGFESTDSDYDVRFLYYHSASWYLSAQKKRDVIEKPITDELDISGWDLKKGLQLMRKSNPPLLEWLRSPIIYRQMKGPAGRFRDLVSVCYSPRNCHYHYYHMARGNCREYIKGDEVWLKKYFYVLRPILACRWIENSSDPVPMEFEALLDAAVDDAELVNEIRKLLVLKKEGAELDKGPAIPVISEFILAELDRLEDKVPDKIEMPPWEDLDQVFREIIGFRAE